MSQPQTASPYLHLADYLFDEWVRLDVVLEIEMQRMMQAPVEEEGAAGVFRGMYLSDSEARRLLDDDDPFLRLSSEQAYLLDQLELRIRSRCETTQPRQIPAMHMQNIFGLTEQDIRMLLVALAPHVNRKYIRLFGYLQDDMSSQHLTLDLLLRLNSRSHGERRRLLERWLDHDIWLQAMFVGSNVIQPRKEVSMLAEPLVLRPRMVHFLLGLNWSVENTVPGLRLYEWGADPQLIQPLLHGDLQQRMRDYVQFRRQDEKQEHTDGTMAAYSPIHWNLYGPSGSGKTFHARHLCTALGCSLLEWDLTQAAQDVEELRKQWRQVWLESKLSGAMLAISCPTDDQRVHLMLQEVTAAAGDVIWMSTEALKVPTRPSGVTWLELGLGLPDMQQSMELWRVLTTADMLPDERELALLAGKFRFTPGQIQDTAQYAAQLADWAGTDKTHAEQLQAAAYSLLHHRLSDKAVKMASRLDWNDLILPTESLSLLRQACGRLHHRHTVLHQWGFDRLLPYGRGISMLFTGPPGTGKTMSALVMAKELRAELYRIDLSRIVSKYIGETEKNLGEIFEQAGQSGAILFFDEADALFGKRSEVKDAHDKYANMETSYLLQKMEEYDGLTILATNFAQNLDDAFTRRIQYIIRFPFPDADHREQLWRSAIPKMMPSEAIDFRFLGETFELTGGPIKNIVLTAAYLAAQTQETLSMKHVLESVIQEYKKTGKLLMKDRFGPYSQFWKG